MNKQRLQELAGITPSSTQLSGLITKAIDSIESNLSYEDFAAAVAHVLIQDYGKHNYAPFIDALSENLKNNLEDGE